jgi:hypothetical protein
MGLLRFGYVCLVRGTGRKTAREAAIMNFEFRVKSIFLFFHVFLSCSVYKKLKKYIHTLPRSTILDCDRCVIVLMINSLFIVVVLSIYQLNRRSSSNVSSILAASSLK